jgi:thiol:disulfide interchange protein
MVRATWTWIRQRENLFWALLLVGVLAWRWPVLKGYYYKFANVAAPASSIEWRTDLASALAESKQTGKPVLVDFSAGWCPPCLAMKHDTWTDARVARAVAASTVPLLIDVDRDPATASRYGVEGIPTVLMLSADGQVLKTAGFLPASGVLRFLGGD